MKLSSNTPVEIPTFDTNVYRVLPPDSYYAVVNSIDTKMWQGRSKDFGNDQYVSNPAGGSKWDYVSLVPDFSLLTETSAVTINRESFTIGVVEDGQIISPAVKYGSGEGNPIWFGSGGAGYLLVSLGLIDADGNLSELDTDQIKDRVVKVQTDVEGFIPRPVSANFKPDTLRSALKSVAGDDLAVEFDNFDALVLRYNLKEGYTEVNYTDEGGNESVLDESNWKEVTPEVYSSLMRGFSSNRTTFKDLAGDGVRLKTKTVITNFYKVEEVVADDRGWHQQDGATYLTKASAKKAGKNKLAGW